MRRARALGQIILFLCLAFSELKGAQRLVLHFDVNKTLIASDLAGGKSVENVLNHLLAEKYTGFWERGQEAPMSYHAYIEQVRIPGDPGDPECKMRRNQFLNRFVESLEESAHPLAAAVRSEYHALIERLESYNGEVFQSFFTLIEYLEAEQIPYSLALRSFGKDLGSVAGAIEARLERPFFDAYARFKQGVLITPSETFATPSSIYHYFVCGKNIVVNDDWHYWHSHKNKRAYGKPFYVDLHNAEVLELFFDDNLEGPDSPTNIVNGVDAATGKPVPLKGLLDAGQLVKVDTLEAILNERYFVEKVQKAIPSLVGAQSLLSAPSWQ